MVIINLQLQDSVGMTWALKFVSFEISNGNEVNSQAEVAGIVKVFSSIWTILYVVRFNLTHLSFNFKALLKRVIAFDLFSKLVGVDVESVYIFWYILSNQKLALTKQKNFLL